MATKTAGKPKSRNPQLIRKSGKSPGSATTPVTKRPVADGKVVSCEAFLRDLSTLVADPAIRNRWVLYVADHRGTAADTKRELVRQCNARGLSPAEYFIGYVDDYTAQDFESAEIEVFGESAEVAKPLRRVSAE